MDQHDGGSDLLAATAPSALRSHAFDRLGAIAAILDGAGTVVDTNAAWRLFSHLNDGSPSATGVGVNYLDVCDRAAAGGSAAAGFVAAGLRQILRGERASFDLEYPCPSPAEDRWFMVQAAAAPIDGGTGVVLLHVDITGQKLLAPGLAQEALHDELTGLPNRRSVVHFVTTELSRAASTGRPMQALYVGVNGFEAVHVARGHHIGDQLLVQVAARIRRVLRSGDLLGRMAGDEFVLVLPGTGLAEAGVMARRLQQVMASPFQVGAAALSIGVSVGTAASHADSTVDSLLAASAEQLHRLTARIDDRATVRRHTVSAGDLASPVDPSRSDITEVTRGMTDAVVAHSNDLVMLFQIDGTIDWISPAARRVFGVEPDDLIGTNGLALVHPDDQVRVFSDFAGIPNLGDQVRTEFRVLMPTGEVRWVEEIATNLFEDPTVGAVVGNVRDITDLRAGEEASALLSSIVGSSNDAILAEDLDGNITTWNDAATRLYGHTRAEILGHGMGMLVPADEEHERDVSLARVWRGDVLQDVETAHRHADGHRIPVSLVMSPVRDRTGEVVGAATVARELSR